MSDTPGKLRLGALVALVVGSMIGGGIFSLPQNMAASADVGAILIGWAITAVGMLSLAFVFQTLANRKPDLDGGVYAYAKAGFGDYMGFSSAWGYWISAWLGNVGITGTFARREQAFHVQALHRLVTGNPRSAAGV